ncbi:MAG TPA: F0F1 ATP synthase subunit B [Anaerolineales bacterium]|nr:F0F1 ATP synthase subunit B [Anaerolineales bacterium]
MAQLGLNLGYLLVQIICFFIIFVVVSKWVVKPLQGLLEKRREKIGQGLEDARVAGEARANAEKEAAGIVADAQAKAAHIISEATERADAAMVEVKTGAEKEIAKEREATLAEVEEERNRMLGDLRGQVAALAIAAAQKLIGEALDEKRQHALLADFFSGIRSGKVVLLEGVEVSGNSAEVISALPLTEGEQATIKKDVLAKMGKQTAIEFHVDPTILGGLVVRVGDKVVDGSVASQLEGLRKSLK